MQRARSLDPTLSFSLIVSMVGLFVTGVLAAHPPDTQNIPFRIQIVTSTFGALCLLGAVAVFFPNRCTEIASGKRRAKDATNRLSSESYTSVLGIKLIHGHHTPLKGFANHEFQIKTKKVCAGCFGLFIGSMASLVTVIAYLFAEADLAFASQSMVGFGIIFISLALATPLFHSSRAIFRIILNAAFIIGMMTILLGFDALAGNLMIDLYLIGLSVFWMATRVLISRSNHQRIYDINN